MSTYFWLCKAGCTWRTSDKYSSEIRSSGVRGMLQDFDVYNTALSLGDNDAFCLEGLGKAELSWDFGHGTAASFSLQTARAGGSLYVWGHHAGFSDLWYVVIVSDQSAVNLNPMARPKSWTQKGGPFQSVKFSQFRGVLDNW
jgi:hypothetical protein